MKQYALTRMRPDGTTNTRDGFKRPRDAATMAAYSLYDNGYADKTEANWFAGELHSSPVGTDVTHVPSGNVYRIDAA